eukprot:GHVN01036413.1.p1 GENE.GHVN01036413.1~~GHVN01036413.1.p1  ORF type:complete len:229 (-),score=34.65 GHVN01036413.1:1151-1837(-)
MMEGGELHDDGGVGETQSPAQKKSVTIVLPDVLDGKEDVEAEDSSTIREKAPVTHETVAQSAANGALASHVVTMGDQRLHRKETKPPACTSDNVSRAKVFIFVNPSSGGNAAGEFTMPGISHMVMTKPNLVEIFIYDIKEGDSGNKPGFKMLRREARKQRSASQVSEFIRVMAAGGDGTVMWCAEEVSKHKVPHDSLAIGVIPFGTGRGDSGATFTPPTCKATTLRAL